MAADRNLDTEPYRPDEERVVAYLVEVTPNIGAGSDPIGFLIASHAALRERLASLDEARVPRRAPAMGDPEFGAPVGRLPHP